ncbi:MAG: hypothetical protein GX638_18705 [Crenarchaeota archaeon]|nr:hypothetical protein [Thermoproteota archaeon]
MRCSKCKRELPDVSYGLLHWESLTNGKIIQILSCIWCDVEYWKSKDNEK